jgi:hypothetical protein
MEFLSDLGSIAVDVIVVYCVVQFIRALFHFNDTINQHRQIAEDIREHLISIVHPVKSEVHNGIMYWFDAEDDTFIAQGRDDAELASALRARWMNHVFVLGDRYVLTGPDFAMTEIKDPDEIGRMLAEKIIK